MSKGIDEPRHVANTNRLDRQELSFGSFSAQLDAKAAEASATALDSGEEELLHQAIRSLQGIRYGSVVLVKHDGRLVEVNTTVRIRGIRTVAENEKGKK